MPAPIVIVHDDPAVSKQVCDAFSAAHYEVACFDDPMTALEALERAQRIQLLITPVMFKAALVSGLTLGRMAHHQRRAAQILFLGSADENRLAAGAGTCLTTPVPPSTIIEKAREMGFEPTK